MTRTRLICTSMMIAAVVYDVIAIALGGVNASISHWFASYSTYPVITFGVGYLCGHFFGLMNPVKPAGEK